MGNRSSSSAKREFDVDEGSSSNLARREVAHVAERLRDVAETIDQEVEANQQLHNVEKENAAITEPLPVSDNEEGHCASSNMEANDVAGQSVTDARAEMRKDGESIAHTVRSEMESDALDLVRDTRTEMREAGESIAHTVRSEMESDAFDLVRDTRTEMREDGESIRHGVRIDMDTDAFDLVRDTTSEMREAGESIAHDARSEMETASFSVVSETRQEMRMEKESNVNDARAKMESMRDTVVQECREQVSAAEVESYENKKSSLKAALVGFYRKKKCKAALSPITAKHVDDLSKIFVAPRLSTMERRGTAAPLTPGQSGEPINSLKEIFFSSTSRRENVYIVGEAGMGKSTFCMYLTSLWCDIQENTASNQDDNEHKKNGETFKDINNFRHFQFVFPLALRGAAASDQELTSLLDTQIFMPVNAKEKYGADFIKKIIRDEKCLFVIDGLDEWPYSIPKKSYLPNSTFVTTMRPWKMTDVCLDESEVDAMLSIEGIDDCKTLIESLLRCLGKRPHLRRCPDLTLDSFKTELENCQLENLCHVPIVVVQLVCLWFEAGVLGNSKCDIYARTLEMLLKRCITTKRLSVSETKSRFHDSLPRCFNESSTRYCLKYSEFLDHMSALAFHTLLSEDQTCSIVFGEGIVQKYLTRDDTTLALEMGILSQYEKESLLEECSTFNFLHKTFQEFLCSVFICTHIVSDNADCLGIVFRVFGETIDILDIAEIFIFVCGMDHQTGASMSQIIANRVDFTEITTDHELTFYQANTYTRMILTGFTEGKRNGHQAIQLSLRHASIGAIFPPLSTIEEEYLKDLVNTNIKNLRTLITTDISIIELNKKVSQARKLTHIQLYNIFAEELSKVDLSRCQNLMQLHMMAVESESVQIHSDNLVSVTISKSRPDDVCEALERRAPKLEKLEFLGGVRVPISFCNALHRFPKLKFLGFSGSNISVRIPKLPGSLKRMVLSDMKIDTDGFRFLEYALSKTRHSVLVETTHSGFDKIQYDALVNNVRNSSVFEIVQMHQNDQSYNRYFLSFRSI